MQKKLLHMCIVKFISNVYVQCSQVLMAEFQCDFVDRWGHPV